jgi:hypothetical protein
MTDNLSTAGQKNRLRVAAGSGKKNQPDAPRKSFTTPPTANR